RAATRIVFYRDLSAVTLDDRPGNGKADSESGRLGRDEGIEYARQNLDGDARAPVHHGDFNAIVACPSRLDPHPALAGLLGRHRVHRVDDQVEEQLQELHAIGAKGRNAVRYGGFDADAALDRIGTHEGKNVTSDCGHRNVIDLEPA